MDKLIKSQLLYQLSYGGILFIFAPKDEHEVEPLVRFELTTHALRMRCSTPELQRRHFVRAKLTTFSPTNQAKSRISRNFFRLITHIHEKTRF